MRYTRPIDCKTSNLFSFPFSVWPNGASSAGFGREAAKNKQINKSKSKVWCSVSQSRGYRLLLRGFNVILVSMLGSRRHCLLTELELCVWERQESWALFSTCCMWQPPAAQWAQCLPACQPLYLCVHSAHSGPNWAHGCPRPFYNVTHHEQIINCSARLSGDINLSSLFFLSHSSAPSLSSCPVHPLPPVFIRTQLFLHTWIHRLSLPGPVPLALPILCLLSHHPVIWEREKDKHVLECWREMCGIHQRWSVMFARWLLLVCVYVHALYVSVCVCSLWL